jgi:hypothetical protein
LSAALSAATLRQLLGGELRRRRMGAHLNRLPSWPAEHLELLLSMYQVPPFAAALKVYEGPGCPTCGTGEHGAPLVRTLMTGPDRWLAGCDRCGGRWLRLER